MQDTLIHIYDENQNYIAGFGEKGGGPNEFTIPPLIRDDIQNNDSTKVFAYNQQLLKRAKINLEASINSEKIVVDKNYNLPKKFRGAGYLVSIDSITIMGTYDDHFAK